MRLRWALALKRWLVCSWQGHRPHRDLRHAVVHCERCWAVFRVDQPDEALVAATWLGAVADGDLIAVLKCRHGQPLSEACVGCVSENEPVQPVLEAWEDGA